MAEKTTWTGVSGAKYEYWVFPIGNALKESPGNYIFAKQSSAGGWIAVYIGETENLNDRLSNHEKMPCVNLNGGTHVHAHLSSDSGPTRRAEEKDLIDKYSPACNKE